MKILVIVDAQNDFIKGSLGAPGADKIADNIATFIENYPNSYDKIYTTTDTHGFNYLDTKEGKALPVKHCIRWTEGWCIYDKIMKALDNLICKKGYTFWENVEKHTYGSQELLYRITQDMIKRQPKEELTIDFCGFDTDICVISNVLMARANFPEATIRVWPSLCWGSYFDNHEAAIAVMRANDIEII